VLCRLLTDQLGDHVSFKIPDGGFAIWLQYLNGLKAEVVAEKAAEMGMSISDGSEYYYDKTVNSSFIRLGFASLNLKELETGVDILNKAVHKLV
jgi:GntR family transcriptional regulator/MocR family aminotransferase